MRPMLDMLCELCKSLNVASHINNYLWLAIVVSGFRGVQVHPLWLLVMYVCEYNCTSPSNDYAAVACSNNSLHATVTHSCIGSLLISRCLTSPTVALRYSVRTST